MIIRSDHLEQGIDHRVAGDEYLVSVDAFVSQAFPGGDGGHEMEIRQLSDHRAVDFLREGLVLVVGAQARFDMADGGFLIESREATGKGGGGVALNQDQVGFFGGDQLLDTAQ